VQSLEGASQESQKVKKVRRGESQSYRLKHYEQMDDQLKKNYQHFTWNCKFLE